MAQCPTQFDQLSVTCKMEEKRSHMEAHSKKACNVNATPSSKKSGSKKKRSKNEHAVRRESKNPDHCKIDATASDSLGVNAKTSGHTTYVSRSIVKTKKKTVDSTNTVRASEVTADVKGAKTFDEIVKGLSVADLEVMKNAFKKEHNSSRMPSTAEGENKLGENLESVDLANLKPINLQEKVCNGYSITLEEIQAANQKNLLLTRNKHVPEMMTNNLREPVRAVDADKTRNTLKSLNPGIDPDSLLETILSCYIPTKGSVGNTEGQTKPTTPPLQRDVLMSKLQDLLNNSSMREKLLTQQPPIPIEMAPVQTTEQFVEENFNSDISTIPVDLNVKTLSASEAQSVINNEVTAKLKHMSNVRQNLLRLHKRDNGNSIPIPSEKEVFDIAVARAMDVLQKAGFEQEQLSGASVQVPASVMLEAGMAFPLSGVASDIGGHKAKLANRSPSVANFPTNVIHNHVSNLEIQWVSSKNQNGTRTVEVIQVFPDPPIYVMSEFLTKDECSEILRQSNRGTWIPWRSPVNPKAPDLENRLLVEFLHLPRKSSQFIERIMCRIASAFNAPVQFVEDLALVRYYPGTAVDGLHDGDSRSKTINIFINDVDKGGETSFPLLGFSVRPHAGTAVMWSNICIDKYVDPRITQSSLKSEDTIKVMMVGFLSSKVLDHTEEEPKKQSSRPSKESDNCNATSDSIGTVSSSLQVTAT